MNKTRLVMRQEIINTLTRRSFQLTVFGLPLISFLFFAGISALQRESPDTVSNIFGTSPAGQAVGEGYVDHSGLIRALPEYLPEGTLKAYTGESAARQALEDGEIQAFYLVPADYLDSGGIVYIRPDFNPISAFDQAFVLQDVLRFNLLGGDSQLAAMVQNPLDLKVTVLEGASERDQDNPLSFFIPYAVTMLYYISILTSASYLLSSIAKEKENQVLEILLVTVEPAKLLTGKFIALGLMGLLQNVLWVVTALVLLRLSGRSFALPAVYQLPPEFLFWGIVFYIFGYGLYASQMAGVGALVPNLKEASQATILVIFPMIVPLFFMSILIEDPNGTLAVILSLVPWTAPVTMMLRLASGDVPLWQLLASSVLLAGTAYVILRSVARLFRAQTLLSGQPFNAKVYLNALLGRA